MAGDDTQHDKARLDRTLAMLFAEESEARDDESAAAHVDVDRLAALRDGSAAEDEREAIRAHLVDCRECAELWRDLAALAPEPEPSQDQPADFGQEAAWRELNARLRPVPVTGEASRWRWSQIAAAALLVTSLALAFQVRQLSETASALRSRVDALEAPSPNVPVIYLDALRSTTSGSTRESGVLEGSADDLVVLMISPSSNEAFESYELEIEDAQGQLLWRGRDFEQNEYGAIRLAVRRALIAGASTLRLFGLRGDERQPAGVYSLNPSPA